MRDYVSNIFDVFKTKSEAFQKAQDVSEIENLIQELTKFQMEFEQKIIMDAAGFLSVSSHRDAIDDKVNPIPLAILRVRDSLEQAIAYCSLLKQDPLANEDEMSMNDTGADIPSMPDMSADINAGDMGGALENQDLEEQSIEEAIGDLIEEPLANAKVEPTIIDEWEYLANDPEFDGNATLLYDKGGFVVFIQKDSDLENPQPYYVQTAGFENNRETQESDFEVLCKWLEINEYPVPTVEAKEAFLGIVESVNEEAKAKEETDYDKTMKELCKDAPKDFKCAQDDPEIGRVAKEVDDPAKGHVDKELEKTDIK